MAQGGPHGEHQGAVAGRSRRNSAAAGCLKDKESLQGGNHEDTRRHSSSLRAPPRCPCRARHVRAQAGYPTRRCKLIVGQAAGSSSDITARLIGQFMSDKLGQQFVVETRPGAAGNIATDS